MSDGYEAWGDESGSDSARDPGVYLMAAVIAEPSATGEIREAMASIKRPGERKIHWRDDSRKRHDEVIEVVASLSVEAFVVVRAGPLSDKDERRRRKTFEPFAIELSKMGCGRLTLESRGRVADGRDLTMLQTMRARQTLVDPLRLEHAAGPTEPALWVADAVCGAVVASRRGEDRWLDVIERSTAIIYLDERP